MKKFRNWKPEQIRSLASFFVFYVGWWGVTILLGRQAFLLVVVLTFASLAVHCVMYTRPMQELVKVLVLGSLGATLDAVLISMGLFDFYSVPKPWLLPIWFIFAASISSYGTAFRGRMWALAGLAAVFGPLSYTACIPLGLVRYPEPYVLSLLLHGSYWALALPAFVWLRDRWDSYWKIK